MKKTAISLFFAAGMLLCSASCGGKNDGRISFVSTDTAETYSVYSIEPEKGATYKAYAPDGSEESRNNTDFSNIINIRKAIFSDNKTYFLGSIKDGAGQIKTVMLTLYGSLLLNTKILTSYGNSQAGHFNIEENYATFIITSNSSYAEYKQNNGQKDLFILCTVY